MEKTSNECSERLRFTIHVKAAPPSAPAAPPTPTTVETAVDGNMSAGVDKRLALQPWWAEAASAISNVAGHALCGKRMPKCGTKTTGTTSRAHSSMVILRPKLTVCPRLMRKPESHPPATEPMLDMP